MKKLILKLTSIFTLLLVSIFCISTKTYAASSSYSIAPSFTFSSDMDIDEGLDLIKPFILYYDGQPSTSNYTFNYEKLDGTWYRFYGTYPDGSPFSVQTGISIIEDASGTYVSALMTQNYYRQSIYVKDLKQGKTTNDCLLECWRNRFVSIKEPTYSVFDEPTQNIYPHMTSFESMAGTYNLMYYAVIENVNYTPDENPEDNANNTTDNSGSNNNNPTDDPSLNDHVVPDDGGNTDNEPTDTPNQGGNNNQNNQGSNDNTTNNNNTNNNNQSPGDNNPSDTNPTNEKDPLLIALISIGALLGFVLIAILIKVVKSAILWLKR